MTCATIFRDNRGVDDEWVTVVSPRVRLRTPQDELNDALAGLRRALLLGSREEMVFDVDASDVDNIDHELMQLAARHWDD